MKKTIKFSFVRTKADSLFAGTLANSKWLILIIGLLSVTAYSCKQQLALSQQLKVRAEKSIQLARSVDADIYAPSEFDSAVSSFDQGSVSLANENTTEANNNFVAAIESASNAYNISLPLFVEILINETDEQIEEAEKILEETSLLEKTIALNVEARNQWNQDDYIFAREKTLEARESIEQARQLSQDTLVEIALSDQRTLQEGESLYIVKFNPEDRDCLWKIAKREMGDPTSWKSLYRRNDDIINDPNLIFPKQKLIIPVK